MPTEDMVSALDDLVSSLPEELRGAAKAAVVQMLLESSPELRRKMDLGKKWQLQLADEIVNQLANNKVSIGGVLYGLLFNVIVLTYLNDGMNRATARDKIASLLDSGFDTVEHFVSRVDAETQEKAKKFSKSKSGADLKSFLDTPQVRAILG